MSDQAMQHQTMRLPVEVVEKVKNLAKDEGRTVSNMYQRILTQWAKESDKKAA